MKAKPKKATIEELEKLLDSEEATAVEIMPNGEIRVGGKPKKVKVLTMRENLGGEYARA